MRGELACDTQGVDVVGLTPAHTGKTRSTPRPKSCPEAHPRSRGETSTSGRRSTSWTAHPRSRGENPSRDRLARVSYGSSPLTRGKRAGEGFTSGVRGLIPAHAGKTRSGPECHATCRAHPRSRGENARGSRGRSAITGSSPLTRGKRRDHPASSRPLGLIPAHAGKTGCSSGRGSRRRAHPRSRGENGGPFSG